MTPTEILTQLYALEEPFKIEAKFDSGFIFCYGYEAISLEGDTVYKQAHESYNIQDGFDWFEGILNKINAIEE